eukprot:6553421-Pyramimonas_sp.AAC.1
MSNLEFRLKYLVFLLEESRSALHSPVAKKRRMYDKRAFWALESIAPIPFDSRTRGLADSRTRGLADSRTRGLANI